WASAALLIAAWEVTAHARTGRWVFINDANSQNLFYGNNPWTPLYRTWWFGSHKAGEPDVPDAYVALHKQIAELPPGQRDRAFTRVAVRHILERPDLFVVRTLARVQVYFAFDSFAGSFLMRRAGGGRALGLAALGLDALAYLFVMGAA